MKYVPIHTLMIRSQKKKKTYLQPFTIFGLKFVLLLHFLSLFSRWNISQSLFLSITLPFDHETYFTPSKQWGFLSNFSAHNVFGPLNNSTFVTIGLDQLVRESLRIPSRKHFLSDIDLCFTTNPRYEYTI